MCVVFIEQIIMNIDVVQTKCTGGSGDALLVDSQQRGNEHKCGDKENEIEHISLLALIEG